MKFTFLTFMLPTMLIAQSDSIPIGQLIYIQEARTAGDFQNNGYATLLFNHTLSSYIQNSAPTRDSSVENINFISTTVAGDKQGFPIYKLHQERRMLCKLPCGRISKKHCIVSDTFGTIKWILYPEHRRFGQFICNRAIGKFRGREYEAWYTLDIPIPSGPFKLGGLPGLILEAKSMDGMIKFLFYRLDISKNIPGFILPPNGVEMKVNYADFIKKELEFNENLVNEARAKGIDISVTLMETIEINTDN